MRTCFLDKKSQEILGEENYPIDEANRIVAMNPESISKDMGEVFKYLCTNANNKIEFVEAPYLNTKQIRQYTDEMEKDPKINFCPLITDYLTIRLVNNYAQYKDFLLAKSFLYAQMECFS